MYTLIGPFHLLEWVVMLVLFGVPFLLVCRLLWRWGSK